MAMGPNVKRLWAHKMALDAVPPGGTIGDAAMFILDQQRMTAGARASSEWVRQAIEVTRKAAEPNPWKDATDEEIAGEILRHVEIKMAQRRAKRDGDDRSES